MSKRYFTINEVNEQIPELERAFHRIAQLHAQVRQIWERLDDQGLAPDSEDFELDEDTPREALDDLATLRMLFDGLQDQIEGVESSGCTIKRLDTGLVDWYAQKDGRDVYLCWQLGEKSVAWWHDLETGFSGRRPISEL
jgi:hypothetical protein